VAELETAYADLASLEMPPELAVYLREVQHRLAGIPDRSPTPTVPGTGGGSTNPPPTDPTDPGGTPQPTAPSAPSGFIAFGQQDGNRLEWTAPLDADVTGYRIDRSFDAGSTWATLNGGALVTPATVVSYTDTAALRGVATLYRIWAKDSEGLFSGYAEASATRPQLPSPAPTGTPPNPPSGLSASASANGVTLTWVAPVNLRKQLVREIIYYQVSPTLLPADLTAWSRRYSAFIFHGYEAKRIPEIKALDQSIVCVLYKDPMQIQTAGTPTTGDDERNNLAIGMLDNPPETWFLHTALPGTSGNRAPWGGSVGSTLIAGNHGLAAYQDKVIANITNQLTRDGWDGVLLDDQSWKLSWTYPAEYPDQATYQESVRAFLSRVSAGIKAAGFKVFANIGSSSDVAFDSARPTWRGYLHGYQDEGWVRPTVSHTGALADASRVGWQVAALKAAEGEGRNFWATVPADDPGTGDGTQATRYGFAAFLLGSAFTGLAAFQTRGTPGPSGVRYHHETILSPDYDDAQLLGEPLGAHTLLASGVYQRLFQNGVVLANPGTATVTVALGSAHTGSGLTNVSSIDLAAKSGAILKKDSGGTPGSPGYTGQNAPAGFNVYRASNPGGPWTRLNSSPIVDTAGVASFLDSTAPSGTTSHYEVRAVSVGGLESIPVRTSAERAAPTGLIFEETFAYPTDTAPTRWTYIAGSELDKGDYAHTEDASFRATANTTPSSISGNAKISLDVRLSSYNATASPSSDGVRILARWVDDTNHYVATINRRDNQVIVRKKIVGGASPSNGGTFYDLCAPVAHTPTIGAWNSYRVEVEDVGPDVHIRVYAGGTLLCTGIDNGQDRFGAAQHDPARFTTGKYGRVADNAVVDFRNIRIETLASTQPGTGAARYGKRLGAASRLTASTTVVVTVGSGPGAQAGGAAIGTEVFMAFGCVGLTAASSVTDSKGNTWSLVETHSATPSTGQQLALHVYRSHLSVALVDGDTITGTFAASIGVAVACAWTATGVSTSVAIGDKQESSGASATPGTPAIAANNGAAAFTIVLDNGGYAPVFDAGTGWTLSGTRFADGAAAVGYRGISVEYRDLAADESLAGSGRIQIGGADSSQNWVAITFEALPTGVQTNPGAPAQPTSLSTQARTSGILLDWADNPDSPVGYRAWRATNVNGPYNPLNQDQLITASTFDDTSAPAGTPVYYHVRAVNAAGVEGPPAVTGPVTRPADTGGGTTPPDGGTSGSYTVAAPVAPGGAGYTVPTNAQHVTTTANLRSALSVANNIVSYDGSHDLGSFVPASGVQLWGLNPANPPLLRWCFNAPTGLEIHGARIGKSGTLLASERSNIYIGNTGVKIMDTTFSDSRLGTLMAYRSVSGAVIQRVRQDVATSRAEEWGLLLDQNAGTSYTPAVLPTVTDIDIRNVGHANPRSGDLYGGVVVPSEGTREAAVWIGVRCNPIQRLRIAGAWMALWTGTAMRDTLVEDVDCVAWDSGVVAGLYNERRTIRCTFRRFVVRAGNTYSVHSEYGDRARGIPPAGEDCLYDFWTHYSDQDGIYLDAGTIRGRVQNQRFMGPQTRSCIDFACTEADGCNVGSSFDRATCDFSGRAAGSARFTTAHHSNRDPADEF
jgi:hypothetical protein